MMKALKQFDYFGLRRRLKVGELFEPCSANDRQVFLMASMAVDVDDKKSKKRYQRADLRAEDE